MFPCRPERNGPLKREYERSASANIPSDKNPEVMLFLAIDRKDIAETKRLLGINDTLRDTFKNAFTATASIECRNEDGFTPLHRACMGGHLEIVKLLLDNNANIHSLNNRQGTALSVAAINNHFSVVDELLNRGFDMKAKNLPAYTNALCWAMHHGRQDMALHLMARGADPLQEGSGSKNGLTMAASIGAIDLVETILKIGICVDATDTCGETPLMSAVRNNQEKMIVFLLECGADVNLVNPRSKGPALSYAARGGSPVVSKLLIEHGADPYLKSSGLSPYETMDISASRGRLKPVFDNWIDIRQNYLDRKELEEIRLLEERTRKISAVSLEGTREKITAARSIRFKK